MKTKTIIYLFILVVTNSTLFAQKGKDKGLDDYKNANLQQQFELNKLYAIKEVLLVLSEYETVVDDKFAGVKNFGTLVSKTNFSEPQNTLKLTGNNSDYWRAVMEMEIENQLIPVTKIYMLVSQGEFDYAIKYIEIVKMFSKTGNYPDTYLKNIATRLELFNKQLNAAIDKGIVEHDKGNFEKAISIYNEILKQYPNSAWANFELSYSQSELNKKNGKENLNSVANWNKKINTILDHNPFYGLPISAQNPEDAYLLFRRNSIGSLFKDKNERLNDVYNYAEIAMDLKIYDFAAELFWLSLTHSKNNEDSIFKYLYCLEQLGVTNLKQNFKGNFEKEFKKIEKEKEKAMTKSEAYKTYHK
jgi:tetratricopeptide (TPR) repeat protein